MINITFIDTIIIYIIDNIGITIGNFCQMKFNIDSLLIFIFIKLICWYIYFINLSIYEYILVYYTFWYYCK